MSPTQSVSPWWGPQDTIVATSLSEETRETSYPRCGKGAVLRPLKSALIQSLVETQRKPDPWKPQLQLCIHLQVLGQICPFLVLTALLDFGAVDNLIDEAIAQVLCIPLWWLSHSLEIIDSSPFTYSSMEWDTSMNTMKHYASGQSIPCITP